jgi:hypothetical protein
MICIAYVLHIARIGRVQLTCCATGRGKASWCKYILPIILLSIIVLTCFTLPAYHISCMHTHSTILIHSIVTNHALASTYIITVSEGRLHTSQTAAPQSGTRLEPTRGSWVSFIAHGVHGALLRLITYNGKHHDIISAQHARALDPACYLQ